jgi:hypothetical protein
LQVRIARDPGADATTLFEPMMILNDGALVFDRLYSDR